MNSCLTVAERVQGERIDTRGTVQIPQRLQSSQQQSLQKKKGSHRVF